MSGKEIGITVKKDQDLSEWYTQVVTKAQLADYSSAKGFMVLMPYGYSIWERIKEDFDKKIKAIGHKNAYFPLLIPERLLKTETEHFAGFTPDVFWVTHSGDTELAEKLAVRPTSETIIYESYRKWVKSWRDLPILINVWNSVVRAEITSTRPFLRTTEFLWQEGHTVHETEQEAEEEVMTILGIYTKLVEEELAIPIIVGRKTEREKFKGAVYTTTMEAMMPDGKAVQMGTSHHLGQKFSIPFEIKYLGKDEKEHYGWTTSWGISWRLIGAAILSHGDDRGLILPPKIAPIQVVIIPIFYKETDQKDISDAVRHLSSQLEQIGIRTLIDDRVQYTPGWKYHEWEMKGVPLRVEIGPKDVQSKQVTVVRRDSREKIAINRSDARDRINKILSEIQDHLFERAKKSLEGLTATASDMQSFKRVLEEKGGFIKAFLSDDSCEEKIKIETGATVRVVPMKMSKKGKCVYCGADNSTEVYFARSY
ncbi:MAG TPA: proline--tRNA ligase [Candidatus Bathyarchaeia archaeon]|nr:proline--tRNA ligase [Candidatus Bathyarchaeia archaeon]